jgi:hypothetical protein
MISKESIQKEISDLWNSFSEDERKLFANTLYGTGLRTFPEQKGMREGQSFLYSLGKVLALSIPTPDLFYCTDRELVSECLGELCEVVFEKFLETPLPE